MQRCRNTCGKITEPSTTTATFLNFQGSPGSSPAGPVWAARRPRDTLGGFEASRCYQRCEGPWPRGLPRASRRPRSEGVARTSQEKKKKLIHQRRRAVRLGGGRSLRGQESLRAKRHQLPPVPDRPFPLSPSLLSCLLTISSMCFESPPRQMQTTKITIVFPSQPPL